MKLGRKPPDYSKPRLWLEDYKTAALPAPTYPVNRAAGVAWPMYMNDSIGDCTCAGIAHAVDAWTFLAGRGEALFADSTIQSLYSAVSGYVAGDASTDNGASMQSVLAYMQATGITDINANSHKISAYAQLVNVDQAHLNYALNNFGSVYVGINCPQSALDQFGHGQPWTYVQGSAIAGGHAIVLQQMDSADSLGFVTWGKLQSTSWDFCSHYVEEAWVALSPDWIESSGKTITGLDLAGLQADMAQVSG